jgi:hypothetical protein
VPLSLLSPGHFPLWLLNKQIQELIEHKPDLRDMINKLRKEKVRGSVASMKASIDKEEKIIDIKDFLDPKLP